MRKLESLSFRYDGEKIWILDQTRLPQEKKWEEATSPEKMIFCIQSLQVRGAPLIGLSAAVVLARLAELGASEVQYREAAKALLQSRPTAVNLQYAIERMTSFRPGEMNVRELVQRAEKIFQEDVDLCEGIARAGADIVRDGDVVLTHCNTGGLATAGVGTAIGVLRRAHEQKKKIHVYVNETRPLLQGGRLTTWEMQELQIPYTLICDSMAAILMAKKKVTKLIVGCDRIALNGDFANKVGTYGLAIWAKHHNIPFYVAGPYTTIDVSCESGEEIPIEERPASEVRGAKGAFGEVEWALQEASVFNPAFDVTPAEMVTGWILDKGILNREDVRNGGLLKCTLS